jgi:hypothetical protein
MAGKRAKTLLEDADRYVRTHSCELECDAFRHGIVSRMTAWVLFRTWKTIVLAVHVQFSREQPSSLTHFSRVRTWFWVNRAFHVAQFVEWKNRVAISRKFWREQPSILTHFHLFVCDFGPSVRFTWHTLWSGKIGLPFLGNFDVGNPWFWHIFICSCVICVHSCISRGTLCGVEKSGCHF